MTNEAPEDIHSWLRVHAISISEISGATDKELLLELQISPVVTTDTLPGLQAQAQPRLFVLGPDAASILLRLLLDKGVVPKDDKIRKPLGH